MQTTYTVDILVTDGQRRVLLVERGKEPFKGKLVLPGGHIDPTDASPAHAAARELLEECGIALTPDQLTPLTSLDQTGRDPRGNYISHVFHVVVAPEVLAAARAGSDAAAIVVRDVASLCPEEIGFDHREVITPLNAPTCPTLSVGQRRYTMQNETTALTVRPARADGPVTKALALFGVVPWSSEQPSKAMIREQLRRVRMFRKAAPEALLPIERPAAVRVLDRQISALEGGSLGFQRIPLDKLRLVLGWRNSDGMPTFAPFSVERDTFEFIVQTSPWAVDESDIRPALPTPLRGCYDDVLALLRKRQGNRPGTKLQASARFIGVIPDDVRRVIVTAKTQFKDIRVLAEVEHWKIEETELPSLRTDPLVIGHDGEEFWLLATFDITPLEDAVRQICTGTTPTAS